MVDSVVADPACEEASSGRDPSLDAPTFSVAAVVGDATYVCVYGEEGHWMGDAHWMLTGENIGDATFTIGDMGVGAMLNV